jgi:hypothetical protein
MASPSRGLGFGTHVPPGIQEEASVAELSFKTNGHNGHAERSSGYSTGQSQSETDITSHQSSPRMVERLLKQNARLREAWEEERKLLQANRERAEEVYKEERALIEEERVAWHAERFLLVQEIAMLKQNLASLGGEEALLSKSMLSGEQLAGQNLRGGGWSTASNSIGNSQTLNGNGTTYAGNGIPGPAHTVDNASSRGLSPPLGGGINESPVPTVDVQEIHPDLEGIPIKATAIQQTTFSDKHVSPDVSKLSSGKPSPPIAVDGTYEAPMRPSKEATLQVLKADVSDRLVMHAGHTPNHSMSFLPTALVSEISTTIDSNGSTTPTIRGDGSGPEDAGNDDDDLQKSNAKGKGKAVTIIDFNAEMPEDIAHDVSVGISDDADLADDRPLKGPLMVRNMPAHDEIFFKHLSDKLEGISRGEDAVPKALKGLVVEDSQSEDGPSTITAGGDGAADAADKENNPKSDDEEEMEIPLKLKRSNNFGAPLGEIR